MTTVNERVHANDELWVERHELESRLLDQWLSPEERTTMTARLQQVLSLLRREGRFTEGEPANAELAPETKTKKAKQP